MFFTRSAQKFANNNVPGAPYTAKPHKQGKQALGQRVWTLMKADSATQEQGTSQYLAADGTAFSLSVKPRDPEQFTADFKAAYDQAKKA